MSNYLELNSNKVFPKGNARISKNASGSIIVSELLETTDGVTIDTNGADKFELSINPVSIDAPCTFGTTMNILDKYRRVKTVAQWAYHAEAGKNPNLVFNSLLEGREILVQFYKDGKEVHNYTVLNECDSQEKNWIQLVVWAVVTIGVAIIEKIDYKQVTSVTTLPNGSKTTTVTTTKSFGSEGKAAKSLSNPTSGNIDFDHIYVTSSKTYDTTVYDELSGPIREVIFTGKFNELELKKISNIF